MDTDTPPQEAMSGYFDKGNKAPRGRPKLTMATATSKNKSLLLHQKADASVAADIAVDAGRSTAPVRILLEEGRHRVQQQQSTHAQRVELSRLRRGVPPSLGIAWAHFLQTVSPHFVELDQDRKRQVQSSLLAQLVDSVIDGSTSVATTPRLADTRSARLASDVMDRAANASVRYHSGWCIVAVRKQLLREKEPKHALLSLIPNFGCDILASKHVYGGDSTSDSSSASSDEDLASTAAFSRHLFSLSEHCLPLFIRLHKLCEEHLQTALLTAGKSAPQEVKQLLLADATVLQQYSAIVGDDSGKDLLQRIVTMFVKSKQKQIIRENHLAPSTTSIALRAGLRPPTSSSRQKEAVSRNVVAVRAAIGRKDLNAVRSAINSVPELDKAKVIGDLSVKELQSILSLSPLSRAGNKGALQERVKSLFAEQIGPVKDHKN
ncbi:uncharacterized protein LOC135816487 [Sycon ciliatum]|uniref:uncharacterized protein LOC135816487 n=1 Tax=Sycon ciliatum TaxID=27933 RepID=UPI0031F60189